MLCSHTLIPLLSISGLILFGNWGSSIGLPRSVVPISALSLPPVASVSSFASRCGDNYPFCCFSSQLTLISITKRPKQSQGTLREASSDSNAP
jgi:hypothetical protein